MPAYACVYLRWWLSACACALASVCLSGKEGGGKQKIDEGGRLERCSAGVGRVVGWQMPEGFIRLEGRGREQFSWKSIRPKHKHRRASNPGLAPAVPLSWLPPLVSLLPPRRLQILPTQSAHTPVPAPASLVQHVAFCFLLFSSSHFPFSSSSSSPLPPFFFCLLFFCLSFLLFLLLPCLSVKRSSH